MKSLPFMPFVVAAIAAVASAPATALDTIEEGLWEIAMRTEIPNMPAMAQQAMKHTQCFTRQDVENPLTTAPKEENCKLANYKVAGNKATWDVKCTGERPMTGTGEMTFSRNHYEGVSKFTGNLGPNGEKMHITQHVNAKRLGACKAGQGQADAPPSPAKTAKPTKPGKAQPQTPRDESAQEHAVETAPGDQDKPAGATDSVLDSAKKLKGLLGL